MTAKAAAVQGLTGQGRMLKGGGKERELPRDGRGLRLKKGKKLQRTRGNKRQALVTGSTESLGPRAGILAATEG